MASETKFTALASFAEKEELKEFSFTPLPLGPNDVEIAVHACGVCHSDLHQVENDWKGTRYPLVPGHEIIGEVVAMGSAVTTHKIGDRVGVSPQSGACDSCDLCRKGVKQACPKIVFNYNSPTGNPIQPHTYGGFASHTRVPAAWAYHIPAALPTIGAAPLLCAGMTVWSPIVNANLKPGSKVGVVGVGGLGHLATQYLAKMGHNVYGITTSADKATEIAKYGAKTLNINDAKERSEAANSFDWLLSTISAEGVNWDNYLALLKVEGRMSLVGAPPTMTITPMSLLFKRLQISGTLLSSPQELKDMLAFSAEHGIVAKTEEQDLVPAGGNAALARVKSNQARYRVVLVNRSKIPVGQQSAPVTKA